MTSSPPSPPSSLDSNTRGAWYAAQDWEQPPVTSALEEQDIVQNLDEMIADQTIEHAPPLIETAPGQSLLREVLMNEFRNRMTTSPPSTTDLHPGYPFREQTTHDGDLPGQHYPRPYVAARVNPVTGEPRIFGRADKESPTYDEGPLYATKESHVADDMEEEVGEYPFGEDAYLDPNFLQAMGTIADRGLAAEGLQLVQLDGEKRFLKQWETRLKKREHDVHVERTDYIRHKEQAARKQTEVYDRLREAKAASRLSPLLPD